MNVTYNFLGGGPFHHIGEAKYSPCYKTLVKISTKKVEILIEKGLYREKIFVNLFFVLSLGLQNQI